MTQTAQTEISATAIYCVTDKQTGTKFFLVKSDSCKNCYHEVRWNASRLAWTCNGEHCQYQRGGTTCKQPKPWGLCPTRCFVLSASARYATFAISPGM